MSRHNKLQKFNDLLTYRNVYENFYTRKPLLHWLDNQHIEMQGLWNSQHFGSDRPITLELACGGGEYTVALAAMYPNRHFIGVDIKGPRIWKGATQALARGLDNAAFVRLRIELIEPFFGPDEVDEIWITFPDPYLNDSRNNRRLTAPSFLEIYRKFLKPGGVVHLKTDEPKLYHFTLAVLQRDPRCKVLYHDDDIYAKELPYPELGTKTHYETLHIADGNQICYIRFTIN